MARLGPLAGSPRAVARGGFDVEHSDADRRVGLDTERISREQVYPVTWGTDEPLSGDPAAKESTALKGGVDAVGSVLSRLHDERPAGLRPQRPALAVISRLIVVG